MADIRQVDNAPSFEPPKDVFTVPTTEQFGQAVDACYRQTHGGAVFVCVPPEANAQELTRRVATQRELFVVDVKDILEKGLRPHEVPADKRGIVLTGYNRSFAEQELKRGVRRGSDQGPENTIENFVRAYHGNNGMQDKQIIVLSNELPNPEVFENGEFWWYNGPFQTDAVWEITTTKGMIKRVTMEARGRYTKQGSSWQPIPSRTYEYTP